VTAVPRLCAASDWRELLIEPNSPLLTAVLPADLQRRRWFRSKAREISGVTLDDLLPTPLAEMVVALLRVSYGHGDDEIYLLPLQAKEVGAATAGEPLCRVEIGRGAAARRLVLSEASAEPALAKEWLAAMRENAVWRGQQGELRGERTAELEHGGDEKLQPRVLGVEQTNTAVRFGETWLLKLFRRLEPGTNPDLELTRFLATQTSMRAISPAGGWLEYRRAGREPALVGLLSRFVANRGDAWQHALAEVGAFFERAKAAGLAAGAPPPARRALPERPAGSVSPELQAAMGGYLDTASLLGQRVGELHCALATPTHDPALAAEPFDAACRRELIDRIEGQVRKNFFLLHDRLATLAADLRPRAEALLACESALVARIRGFAGAEELGQRIRLHGDLHLGQVLFTGRDFVFIDFEGEPSRPLAERRLKGSALRDVAGMLRSFHYAAFASFLLAGGAPSGGPAATVASWAGLWQDTVSASFLRGYVEATRGNALLPRDPGPLLELFLLEKAVYELGYELNNRPDWLAIPVDALERIALVPTT
jgi:trehalose synthase-fused probable maltokinase